MKRLLIIDGHNLLFQMFFGMPARIVNKDGIAIHGVIGFVGALNKLICRFKPSHVVALFDSQTHNPRVDILDEYKKNRPNYEEMPDEENPFSQLRYIYSALDAMGIVHCEICDAETDDVIASYALSSDNDTEIYISSFDSDFFQLISDRVRIIRYKGDSSVICDVDYIQSKLGILPENYADFKAMVGDSADNIKGVAGIGKVTAAKLLSSYGSLENMLACPSIIKDEKLQAKICNSIPLIKRNVALIKLDAHAPMPFEYGDMLYRTPYIKTMEVIKKIGL